MVLRSRLTAQLDPAFLHLPQRADPGVLVERWAGTEVPIPTKEVMRLFGLMQSSVTAVSVCPLP